MERVDDVVLGFRAAPVGAFGFEGDLARDSDPFRPDQHNDHVSHNEQNEDTTSCKINPIFHELILVWFFELMLPVPRGAF
jgi:hypothetical protein